MSAAIAPLGLLGHAGHCCGSYVYVVVRMRMASHVLIVAILGPQLVEFFGND